MGLFKRPTTGDRLDNAAARNYWRKAGPAAVRAAQIEAEMAEAQTRIARHKYDRKTPYRGSKTEAEHRKGGKKK